MPSHIGALESDLVRTGGSEVWFIRFIRLIYVESKRTLLWAFLKVLCGCLALPSNFDAIRLLGIINDSFPPNLLRTAPLHCGKCNAMKGRQRQAKAVMRLVSSFSLDASSAKSTASFGTCRARAARHDAQCALTPTIATILYPCSSSQLVL